MAADLTGGDFALVASAGAVALALSSTLWAWRYRRRAESRAAELEERIRALRAELAEARVAGDAFEGALIAREGETLRLVSGDAALSEAAAALGVAATAEGLVDALLRRGPDAAAAIKALFDRGEPCRFEVSGAEGEVGVEGRAIGAIAWLRISPPARGAAGGRSPFALLAERLPAPAWIIDQHGQLTWANRAWLEAVDAPSLEAARVEGGSLDPALQSLLSDAAASGRRVEGFRWATVKGQRRAWRVVADPIGDGEVGAVAIDVTEAEENREALRTHVAAHDETLNHLADAVAIFGPNKRLSFHNTAFQEMWELDAGWLAERPSHGELLDRLRQRRRLPETMDYGAWKARELDFYGSTVVAPDEMWSLPDGRTLRVVRQPHPMGGVLLLFSDITGELKLRAQYNSLIQVQRATLDKLNDAVAVFGSDGRLRLYNESFERFWGLTALQLQEAADFDGVAELCLPLVHDRALWRELKARVTDTDPEARAPISGETRATDGRIAAWQSRPLPDGATLVAFDDITATKNLERALSERSAALAEAQRLKRDFVGNVSYELRTPLTTIIGYAELLEAQGKTLPARALAHVGSVRAAATQLARSIDDVLDMAQIDAGEMGLSLGDVRVCDVLQTAAERVQPLIADRAATLEVVCPEDAGLIRADERRIGQALDHLLENAARATPPGGTVTLSAKRAFGSVQIQVTDNGRGIPFHVQAHVFDRFVGRDRGGPGLGLALVKALVELHGGWVALESEPGAGATFTLHLPEQAAVTNAAPELALGR
jgi:hypothetical protein